MIVALIIWATIAAAGTFGLALCDLIQPSAHFKLCCLLWCAWPLVAIVAIGCLLWCAWGDLARSTVERRRRWDYF
jgi:hypothetical protein